MPFKKCVANIKISHVNGNKYVCNIAADANFPQHFSLLSALFGFGY